jgi:23S rRNA (pseudouridine1915-N3)-methyltransferase
VRRQGGDFLIKVNIICVGKLKESYWRDAVKEYAKRLSAYCNFDIAELNESRLPDNPSDKNIADSLEKEAGAMEKFLQIKGAYNVAMCIEGKTISSEKLSEKVTEVSVSGYSTINFFIGSSFGLSDRVKSACMMKMSMSPMTFPHQLARVMLCEQIYRAFSIANNGKYHK